MPRSDKRPLRSFLEQYLEHGEMTSLQWINKEKNIFQLLWLHANNPTWSEEDYGALFKQWAIYKGHYKQLSDGTWPPHDYIKWKANFSGAIKRCKDILTLINETGHKELRQYQFIDRGGARSMHDGEDSESVDSDYRSKVTSRETQTVMPTNTDTYAIAAFASDTKNQFILDVEAPPPDMESTEFNIQGLHNNLSLALSEQITGDQLMKLKQHFRKRPFGVRILEKIKDFLKLWNELETTGFISTQRYDKLKDAFESIQASSHKDVIQEFEEKMCFEAGSEEHKERRTYKETITKETFLKRIKLFRPLMEEDDDFNFGTVHVYNNAVFGLISRTDGGMLGLENGSAKLQIERNTITNNQEVFWIFRPPADAEEVKRSDQVPCRPIDQSSLTFNPADEHERSRLAIEVKSRENNNDHVVKYSLPVNLGPAGVSFKQKVILTLKGHFSPNTTTGPLPLAVYKRTGGNGTWHEVGSCFFDRNRRSANVPLSEFSSYVLGMPATSELLPLNVHIMVQRLSKIKDDTTQPCDIKVVFSMNDHTYIQEMVLRKRMKIVCETSYYLDPKSDVMIRWEKRNADGSVCLKQTAVLEKGRLNRLAEKMQSVTIPIQDEVYLDEDHKDFVILEQNDIHLMELFCRDDRPMKEEETTPKSPRRWAVRMAETEVLETGRRLNRLEEEMQSLSIPIQDEQQLVEDGDKIVILEQNDTNLVELLCRDDRPMNEEETTPKWPRRHSDGLVKKDTYDIAAFASDTENQFIPDVVAALPASPLSSIGVQVVVTDDRITPSTSNLLSSPEIDPKVDEQIINYGVDISDLLQWHPDDAERNVYSVSDIASLESSGIDPQDSVTNVSLPESLSVLKFTRKPNMIDMCIWLRHRERVVGSHYIRDERGCRVTNVDGEKHSDIPERYTGCKLIGLPPPGNQVKMRDVEDTKLIMKNVGNGIHLSCDTDGNIFATRLTRCRIYYADPTRKAAGEPQVLPRKHPVKVFDRESFCKNLAQWEKGGAQGERPSVSVLLALAENWSLTKPINKCKINLTLVHAHSWFQKMNLKENAPLMDIDEEC